MTDAWDDRKKALEEEYFRKKDQEAIEKLRAQRAAARAQGLIRQCPKGDGALTEVTHEEVQIDRCDKCGGVWLDAGELELLTRHSDESGLMGRFWRSLSPEKGS